MAYLVAYKISFNMRGWMLLWGFWISGCWRLKLTKILDQDPFGPTLHFVKSSLKAHPIRRECRREFGGS